MFLLIRYIFRRSIPKIGNFAEHERITSTAKFSFIKNRRGLRYEYFLCENLRNPSLYIKKQSPIRKFEIKSCLVFFKNPQKWPKQFLI